MRMRMEIYGKSTAKVQNSLFFPPRATGFDIQHRGGRSPLQVEVCVPIRVKNVCSEQTAFSENVHKLGMCTNPYNVLLNVHHSNTSS